MFKRIKNLLNQPASPPASRPATPPVNHEYELVKFSDSEGRGLVVRRLSDLQKLSWQTLPKRDGLQSLKVAGTSHRLKALQAKAFEPGNTILLVPEPENPHDPNAIAVYDADHQLHVGYVPANECKRILRKIEKERFACLSMWEVRKGKQRVALRVLLIDEKTLPRVKGVTILD